MEVRDELPICSVIVYVRQARMRRTRNSIRPQYYNMNSDEYLTVGAAPIVCKGGSSLLDLFVDLIHLFV